MPTAAIIPAFQAASWLGEVVSGSKRQLDQVLVVDDGSTDRTAEVAKDAGAEVLELSENRGKGFALVAGFERLLASGYEQIVTLDADGQHLPEEIPLLVEAARDGADLVIGDRTHLFQEMAGIRRWSNRISSRLISFAAGAKVRDVQSGFRLYTRRVIEQAPFLGGRFEAESSIVVRATRSKMVIATVPIHLGFVDGRRTSHYRPIIDSCRIAASVTRARLERTKTRQKLRWSGGQASELLRSKAS